MIVTAINGIGMHMDGEGDWERGDQCFVGSSLAGYAYSCIYCMSGAREACLDTNWMLVLGGEPYSRSLCQ